MTFILGLLKSKLARQIGGVVLILLSILTFGKVQKRKGVTQERDRQEGIDDENSKRIGHRVRVAKSDSMPDDELKYRDD